MTTITPFAADADSEMRGQREVSLGSSEEVVTEWHQHLVRIIA
jgi:hypothetical protein